MRKYILHAKSRSDMIALLVNSNEHVHHIVSGWSISDIYVSEDDVSCSEEDLIEAYLDSDWAKIDEYIMGSDVGVGNLVIVSDGSRYPKYGFVCGNGQTWHSVRLSSKVSEAIIELNDSL